MQDYVATMPAAQETGELPLIEAVGVRKKYCRDLRRSLWYGMRDVARAVTLRGTSQDWLRPHEFWAVDGVTFTMHRGDCIGILGVNGSGKSTLIKLITGQRKLTAGQITTRGRIVALTELGLGFNGVLTGRENIYVNASVFGVGRAEVDGLIDDIIDFAGIPDFIDSAVQTYSTGMRARLSFSIAAHLEPDMLIIDEVLAVGDLAFRRKCVSHIAGYLKRGGSMLLVAHDPYLIGSICNRAIVLERGQVVMMGTATEGVAFHFEQGQTKEFDSLQPAPEAAPAAASQAPVDAAPTPSGLRPLTDEQPVSVDAIEVLPVASDKLTTNGPARVVMRYRSSIAQNVAWSFVLCTTDLLTVIAASATGVDGTHCRIEAGSHTLVCDIPRLPLRPGNYAVRGGIADAKTYATLSDKGVRDTPPDYFSVALPPGPPTLLENYLKLENPLVVIDTTFPAV